MLNRKKSLSAVFAVSLLSLSQVSFASNVSEFDHPDKTEALSKTVLSTDTFTVSQYIAEKNFRTHLDSERRASHPQSNDSFLNNWRQEFINRALLIHAAMKQGYDHHPEVLKTVDRMEQHMLSNPTPLLGQGESIPQFSSKADASLDLELEEATLKSLIGKLSNNKADSASIPEDWTQEIANHLLARFTVSDTRKTYTVSDYVDHHNARFINSFPDSESKLRNDILMWSREKYTEHLSRQKGFDKEWKFQEDRKNFLQNQIIYHFTEESLKPTSLSEEELRAYYNSNLKNFKLSSSVKVEEYVFLEIADAYQAYSAIKMGNGADAWESILATTPSERTVVRPEYRDLTPYEQAAFKTSLQEFSHPVTDETGAIIILKKTASEEPSILNFEQAYPLIKAELLDQKTRETKTRIIAKTQENASLREDIDLQRLQALIVTPDSKVAVAK